MFVGAFGFGSDPCSMVILGPGLILFVFSQPAERQATEISVAAVRAGRAPRPGPSVFTTQ